MANNPYVNKVEYGGSTLIDLTGDDVTEQDVLNGKKFHLASGAPAVGTATSPSPSSSDPLMDGTASPGVSDAYARGDHVHPTDTSRLAVYDNAGAHNGIYRGKYLGAEVTQAQWGAIDAGTFEDLYIGDYWTIGGVNYRIAAFDYWLNTGDTKCTTHHVVIVSDTCLYTAQMNTSDVVTGAYVGSKMYTTNLAQAKTTINNAFGSAHILNHREYLKNAVSGNYETVGAFYDSTVELMTEQMTYGCKIFANCMQAGNWAAQYTIDKSQLPLFALEPSRIGIGADWWLRDVASSTAFALVGASGDAYAAASTYPLGVRPAFGICS